MKILLYIIAVIILSGCINVMDLNLKKNEKREPADDCKKQPIIIFNTIIV